MAPVGDQEQLLWQAKRLAASNDEENRPTGQDESTLEQGDLLKILLNQES